MKTCRMCKHEKPFTDFTPNKVNKDGRGPYCKPCGAEYQRRRRKPNDGFAAHIKHRYGLSYEDYLAMLDRQNGRCAICGTHEYTTSNKARLHVDHDHTTGTVRGLLCHNCNLVLGNAKDSRFVLESAIRYLEVGNTQ